MAKHSATSKPTVEQRLAQLELQIAQLTANADNERPTKHSTAGDLLKHVYGVFENDSDFVEVVEYGRKWRESQRPNTKTRKAKNARARH